MKTYIGFDTWADVRIHISQGMTIYYHAPMDHSPRWVQCKLKGDRVRVTPPSNDCDPFMADSSHLSRFRKVE